MHSSHTKPALRSAADATPFGMLAACNAIIGIGDHRGGPALEQMESNEAFAKPSLELIDLPRASLGLLGIRPRDDTNLQPCRHETSAAGIRHLM